MRRAVVAVLAVATVMLAAPTAGAQAPAPCAGVELSASVAAPSIPGGAWAVEGTCVELETVYEVSALGYQLVLGLGADTYTDGHDGRVAFATVRLSDTEALTLVGVEDVATEQVTWAYSESPRTDSEGVRAVSAPAKTATITPELVESEQPAPVEDGTVSLSITGTGTDLATAEGPVADTLRQLLDLAVEALGGQGG